MWHHQKPETYAVQEYKPSYSREQYEPPSYHRGGDYKADQPSYKPEYKLGPYRQVYGKQEDYVKPSEPAYEGGHRYHHGADYR